MDGRGRVQDNIIVEHLWWTVSYHYIYLHIFDNGAQLRAGLRDWFKHYNHERFHQGLDDMTPNEVYYGLSHPLAKAA
jgi:putative transposase